jgi:hypothetical protein
VVSSVHARLSRSRKCPVPRPTAVSNENQASSAPFAWVGCPSAVHAEGLARASVAASIALIASRPSKVFWVHENASRSRQ